MRQSTRLLAMARLLVLHGPNLNLLGVREPEIYGHMSLADINRAIEEAARERQVETRIVQANSEGALVDALHEARTWADGIIVNAGAYTHYSYAIADALAAVKLPAIEVHLSNIYARESWRHRSVLAPVVTGSICGLGWQGYVLALNALVDLVGSRSRSG
jgi:3-dehydroquinate dehydratase II